MYNTGTTDGFYGPQTATYLISTGSHPGSATGSRRSTPTPEADAKTNSGSDQLRKSGSRASLASTKSRAPHASTSREGGSQTADRTAISGSPAGTGKATKPGAAPQQPDLSKFPLEEAAKILAKQQGYFIDDQSGFQQVPTRKQMDAFRAQAAAAGAK